MTTEEHKILFKLLERIAIALEKIVVSNPAPSSELVEKELRKEWGLAKEAQQKDLPIYEGERPSERAMRLAAEQDLLLPKKGKLTKKKS